MPTLCRPELCAFIKARSSKIVTWWPSDRGRACVKILKQQSQKHITGDCTCRSDSRSHSQNDSRGHNGADRSTCNTLTRFVSVVHFSIFGSLLCGAEGVDRYWKVHGHGHGHGLFIRFKGCWLLPQKQREGRHLPNCRELNGPQAALTLNWIQTSGKKQQPVCARTKSPLAR